MAEDEEEKAAQGSPSPAPRPWRDSKPKQSPSTGNETPSDAQSRRKRFTVPSRPALDDSVSSVGSSAAQSLRSEVSEGSFDEKLRRHAAEQGEFVGDSPKRNSGLFSKSRLGTKVAEMGKGLVRKTSRGSLDGGSPTQSSKPKPSAGWLSRRFSSRKSEPSNGMAEHEGADKDQGRFTNPPPSEQSPVNKSFAWEADADFTAGDLQVSESPPVVIGRTNTKIDEIRELEAKANEIFPEPESPKLRPRNTRIDEIRAAELEAAQMFPDEPVDSREEVKDTRAGNVEDEDMIPRTLQTRRPSATADDLRAREIESLSRRALATTRLDEIRERDAEYRSRSSSPELVRQASRELLRSLSPVNGGARKQEKQGASEGTAVDEVPSVAIVAASTQDDGMQAKPVTEGRSRERMEGAKPSRSGSQARDASRDVLRRLALATSTTPSPEQQQRGGKEEIIIPIRGRDGKEAPRQRKLDGLKSDVRLTVGFAGLRRDSSVESGSDKRSNFAQSDSDPIERIEAEMQLFAPLENHSERGSLRAPSPDPDEDAPNETPRPPKPDALTQPTPRVTGAYVETPATIKVEKLEFGPALDRAGAESNPSGAASGADTAAANAAPLRGRKQNGSARRPRPASTVSAEGDVPTLTSRSASLSAQRRSRSLPRQRSTLINSARPPTVKDDLLEIQRSNHAEDSTLDDFADVLDAHERDHLSSNPRRAKLEDSDDDLLDTFDRMNKSLQTGLLGIQSAKRGIERLENEVSHADSKRHSHSHDVNVSLVCAACHGHPSEGTGSGTLSYLHLPMPRLWRRQRGFKFTLLGGLLFLLSLWYIVESSMCFFFCKPEYCYPGKPCDWSMDDPHWGYSIPVKLDQWTTGGKGRALADKTRPEVADWLADIWDLATGTDIRAVDTSHYNWKQRRQHRRRLVKKGLVPSPAGSPEDRAKFAARRAAGLARDRTESAQEMGYDVSEEESMAGDERI